MSLTFRVVLVLVSLLMLTFVLNHIRKSKFKIENSIFWIFIAFAIIILSVFSQIADFMSHLIGVASTVNFIFLSFIFVLILKNFYSDIKISKLESNLEDLSQKIAIMKNIEEEKEK